MTTKPTQPSNAFTAKLPVNTTFLASFSCPNCQNTLHRFQSLGTELESTCTACDTRYRWTIQVTPSHLQPALLS